MSVRVMSRIWNLDLPASVKLVALRLADAADDDGANVFPSLGRIARDTGLCRNTVISGIRRLRRDGVLVQDHGGDVRAHLAALYHFDLDRLPSAISELGASAADELGLVQPLHGASAAIAPQPSLEPSLYPSTKLSAAEVDEAIKVYADVATRRRLPIPRKITPTIRQRLRARLTDHGIDGWREAMSKLDTATWMHGGNDRGWRANLHFLLRKSSFDKLVDGVYDRTDSGTTPETNGAVEFLSNLGESDEHTERTTRAA